MRKTVPYRAEPIVQSDIPDTGAQIDVTARNFQQVLSLTQRPCMPMAKDPYRAANVVLVVVHMIARRHAHTAVCVFAHCRAGWLPRPSTWYVYSQRVVASTLPPVSPGSAHADASAAVCLASPYVSRALCHERHTARSAIRAHDQRLLARRVRRA